MISFQTQLSTRIIRAGCRGREQRAWPDFRPWDEYAPQTQGLRAIHAFLLSCYQCKESRKISEPFQRWDPLAENVSTWNMKHKINERFSSYIVHHSSILPFHGGHHPTSDHLTRTRPVRVSQSLGLRNASYKRVVASPGWWRSPFQRYQALGWLDMKPPDKIGTEQFLPKKNWEW